MYIVLKVNGIKIGEYLKNPAIKHGLKVGR
jgi:hypothetical protein